MGIATSPVASFSPASAFTAVGSRAQFRNQLLNSRSQTSCLVAYHSQGVRLSRLSQFLEASSMGWSAADWIEGAGGCLMETIAVKPSARWQDWNEGASSCYIESWRVPSGPRAHLDQGIGAKAACGVPPPVIRSVAPRGSRLSTNQSATKPAPALAPAPAAEESTLRFDFVVVGSGVAGLRYALAVASRGMVAVVTKSEPQESNTKYAQGGVSAVLDPLDSVENHIRDTIVAGAYLCDEEAVEVVCREGPDRVRELMAMGASFDKGEDGQLHLAREGGHSHHRIVHSADVTGREIERALLTAVQKNPNIRLFEHHFVIDLLTRQENNEAVCYGLDALDLQSGQVMRFLSGALLLASGGAGHVYPNTTNPTVATGDGVALTHRARATISNMEFVQFHPTALADTGLPIKPKTPRENAFLITEAVRGAGGILYNQDGERFMPRYDSRGELAPRDVVARSIDDQLKTRGEKFVWLDISHKPAHEILAHFPNIAIECLRCGVDITKQPIPVVPAAHYMCGGVQTGLHGETSIRGLWAAGEVACTGLHGANRLASNSLLEALVFAQRAVEPSVKHSVANAEANFAVDEASEWPRPQSVDLGSKCVQEVGRLTGIYREQLQNVMWDYVGIVRSTDRLDIAERELACLEASWQSQLARAGLPDGAVTREVGEMRNLVSVSKLIITSAKQRQESRGLHYTIDFPQLVESQRLPTVLLFQPAMVVLAAAVAAVSKSQP